MALVRRSGHKLSNDTSQFCFVNSTGQHVSPRSCQCQMVPRGGATSDFDRYSPTLDQKRRYANAAMPNDQFRKEMMKQFGRVNPDCPIQDPHSPIDPRPNGGKGGAQ